MEEGCSVRWSNFDPGIMEFHGKCSWFGGTGDIGMHLEEGLAYYEHSEADRRPDLFLPRSDDSSFGTSQRLRPEALFLALRVPQGAEFRKDFQGSCWLVTNEISGKSVLCSLVDWGPNERTGRCADLSRTAFILLRLATDDEVTAVRVI